VEGIQNPPEGNQNQPEQNQSPAERNPNGAERNPNLTSFHESKPFQWFIADFDREARQNQRDAHSPQLEQTVNRRLALLSRKW